MKTKQGNKRKRERVINPHNAIIEELDIRLGQLRDMYNFSQPTNVPQHLQEKYKNGEFQKNIKQSESAYHVMWKR